MRSGTSLASSLRTLALATAGVLLALAPPTWAIGPFCRSPSVPIPDLSTISDNLNVSATDTISDLDVSVDISHSYVGDLVVTLTHVDTGTSVTLIDRPGAPPDFDIAGCSNDDIVATLDDEAASPVENQCEPSPAIVGTFSPNNPLSAFDGESIAGTWTLTVSDENLADAGTLNAWCLLPTTGPADTVCTAGTPGRPNCHGQCIAALAHDHGDIAQAASDLGFSSVAALQAAVTAFCGN